MRYETALREQGVALLRGVFPKDILARLKIAAAACLSANHSAYLPALLDFGIASRAELLAPVAVLQALVEPLSCDPARSWVRKRFAPRNAPPLPYQPNSWHQDGGLGVAFTPDPTHIPEMTRLLTCWIPLQDCGKDSPGLEFVRRPLDHLLHYTELDDVRLHQRFARDDFWAPDPEFGDGLLFLPGTLHRTHVHPEMQHDRLSLEYRFFPV